MLSPHLFVTIAFIVPVFAIQYLPLSLFCLSTSQCRNVAAKTVGLTMILKTICTEVAVDQIRKDSSTFIFYFKNNSCLLKFFLFWLLEMFRIVIETGGN